MRKVKLFNYINICIAIVFVITIVFQGVFKFIPLNLARFWFPCFLVFVSISLFAKFFIFHNPAILWFALVLLLSASFIFCSYFIPLKFEVVWPIYLLIPAICSFVVFVCFRSFFQLSVASCLFSLGFPLFLLTVDILSGWKFVVVLIISLLLGCFVINICIGKLRKNRKKCNG